METSHVNFKMKKLCPYINNYLLISKYQLHFQYRDRNLTICSYHVTYTFWSESSLYSCLNVEELLTRNRRDIWSLSDCNRTRNHNHLVRKRTLNHLSHSSIWPVPLDGWVFAHKLSGFNSCCSHLDIYFKNRDTLVHIFKYNKMNP